MARKSETNEQRREGRNPEEARYGEELPFHYQVPIAFPQFEITFLRTDGCCGPGNVSEEEYVFEVKQGRRAEEVKWSNTGGDFNARFTVGGTAFDLDVSESSGDEPDRLRVRRREDGRAL
jgi:hypothetical protein